MQDQQYGNKWLLRPYSHREIRQKKTGQTTGLVILSNIMAYAIVFLIITDRRRTPSRIVSGLAAEKLSRMVLLGPPFG